MKISTNGIALIQAFEGCLRPIGDGRFQAYRDPIGVLTICYGHTNHHGRQFDADAVWTQAECDAEFASDMVRFERAVENLVSVILTQDQFDALVSFAYNCGEGNLAKSTLLKKVNAGDSQAAGEFIRWNKAGGRVLSGLTRRRIAESLLFEGRVEKALQLAGTTSSAPVKSTPVSIPAPPPSVPAAGTAAAGGALGYAAHALGLPDIMAIAIAGVFVMAGIVLFIVRKRRKS